MPTVGFYGSRNLVGAGVVQIGVAVGAFARAGRDIATGCAVGADAVALAAALSSAGPSRTHIYAAFDEFGRGAWRMSNVKAVLMAAAAGADVHWLAGGPLTYSLVYRLAARSRKMVAGVTGGPQDVHSGIVGWITAPPPGSPGSWGTVRFAAGVGLRIVVCNVGWPSALLPVLGAGAWVPAGTGLWASAWLWKPGRALE